MAFGERQLTAKDAAGRAVLEVGARHVQQPPMSLRAHVMAMQPASYVGVDIAAGPGVDVVCRAEQLVERFGAQSFDLVICTEMLEHVDDWRGVIRNLKLVLRPQGVLVLTTRSIGFPYHAWPHDHWRFQLEDMRAIFQDLTIEALEDDSKEPGVFLRARRPEPYREHTPELAVYSVITGRRLHRVPRLRTALWTFWFGMRRRYITTVPRPVRGFINRVLGRRAA